MSCNPNSNSSSRRDWEIVRDRDGCGIARRVELVKSGRSLGALLPVDRSRPSELDREAEHVTGQCGVCVGGDRRRKAIAEKDRQAQLRFLTNALGPIGV